MISVSSHIETPRLRYVLHFLSGWFALPFALNEPGGTHTIIYGDEGESNGLQVKPSGLLSETVLRHFTPPCSVHEAGFPVLFENDSAPGFDIFSGIFYLLSRYEEYGPHHKDEYGRYAHTNSIAHQHSFLQRPLIHEWLAYFSKLLFGEERRPAFSFQPTYDIDMAWSYRHKGVARNAGGFLRSLFKGDGKTGERLAVLLRSAPDPFDCYAELGALHRAHKLKPLYFIHAGTKRTSYDKSISLNKNAMASLVKRLAGDGSIGLHPSWASGDEPHLLVREKAALERTIANAVATSRQHYIRFTLPQTFRSLLAAGIDADYSMGYGSINGFRASVSVPFYWYDLEREEQTSLLLHPFCFMDANAYYEEKKSAEEMERELFYYEKQLRLFGGTLITIWHNTILGSSPEFAGWFDRYKSFVELVTSRD